QGEIGGYEVRYKKTADTQYTTVMINDNSVEQYVIDELENADSYSFEVAAFDTDGVYSQFITAN
ncbi:MAG: fibronectin type III domain-containing protein, partial [Reinekea sp.]